MGYFGRMSLAPPGKRREASIEQKEQRNDRENHQNPSILTATLVTLGR